jgi:muramoyltetrapeptide carboxypeptidase
LLGEEARAEDFFQWVQEVVGASFLVSGRADIIEAGENEHSGGRHDDDARARELEQALEDDAVAAIVALRGGAWFTRILPLINFSVLDRRTRPVAVFGFSELTTLVNIVAAHPMGRGVYDMGPAFLSYGLKRHAESVLGLPGESSTTSSSESWTRTRFLPLMRAYFEDIVGMIEGRGTIRPLRAQCAHPAESQDLPERFTAEFMGGNLCVLTTLIGSVHRSCIECENRWLILEDLNEKPERIDRFLAHLTLAGFWERCQGILLGDFHRRSESLTTAVLAMLPYHLRDRRSIPILTSNQIGHIWPMAPLPLSVPIEVRRIHGNEFLLQWQGERIRTVRS